MGGKPPPRVVWYKNSQLFSEQFVREEDAMTGALVTYNNLSLLAIPRYVEEELQLLSRLITVCWVLSYMVSYISFATQKTL